MLATLLVFAVTYLLLSGLRVPGLPASWSARIEHIDRTAVALAGAVAMVFVGLPLRDAFAAIHLDTLALLFGMMVLTAYLVEARFFAWLAHYTLAHAGTPRALLIVLVVVAGALSALLVNDTVCLMLTPLVLAVVEAAALPPLPFLLALSTASNIGSVATLTGNPQNMIIGTRAHLAYGDYLAHLLPVAALGLAADVALLLFLFRRVLPRSPLPRSSGAAPTLDEPLVAKTLMALSVALAGFFLGCSLAGSAVTAAALLIAIAGRPPRPMLERVDYPLLVFFAALFVVVAGVAQSGALALANAWVTPRLGHSVGQQLVTFSAVTVVGSNLFSNVPFVLLGLDAAAHLLDPARGYLALAMAATLAGNLTLIGSVANLIVVELAARHPYAGHPAHRVGFFEFLRVGALVTAVTVSLGVAVLLAEAKLGW